MDTTRSFLIYKGFIFCYTLFYEWDIYAPVTNYFMEKSTNPKKVKRKRKHGFMARKKTQGGKRVIKRRRDKKRTRIAV